MDIKILVSTHKPYKMPKDTSIYLPVQVGCDEVNDRFGYQCDNTGDNISYKHKHYSELSAVYWGWKNLNCDYMGICHYRRYFTGKRDKDKWKRIASKQDIEKVLNTTDVILPHKRNYYIETNYNQYAHAHHAIDLDTTRTILEEKCPEYIPAFDSCMKKTSGHKFNMFIMKRELADAYCEWLFSVLFELEKRLDILDYSAYDTRVFGFVAERLMDVWIETNHVAYKEMPVVLMERQNWFIKGLNFVKRKFISG